MELNPYFSLEIYCKCMCEDESNFASTLGTAPEILFYSTTSQLLAAVNLLQLLHSNFTFNEILQANIFIRQKCHSVSTKLLCNDSADSSFKLQEGWYLNYWIYFVTLNNYRRVKVEFHLFYPWMSVMYLMCWFLTIENKVGPGWPASCRCSFVLTNLIPLIGSLPTELTFWEFVLIYLSPGRRQNQLSSHSGCFFIFHNANFKPVECD